MRPVTKIAGKPGWNRSSAHSPEVIGAINSGFAVGMQAAADEADRFSLSDSQRRPFFAAVADGINTKVKTILEFLQQQPH